MMDWLSSSVVVTDCACDNDFGSEPCTFVISGFRVIRTADRLFLFYFFGSKPRLHDSTSWLCESSRAKFFEVHSPLRPDECKSICSVSQSPDTWEPVRGTIQVQRHMCCVKTNMPAIAMRPHSKCNCDVNIGPVCFWERVCYVGAQWCNMLFSFLVCWWKKMLYCCVKNKTRLTALFVALLRRLPCVFLYLSFYAPWRAPDCLSIPLSDQTTHACAIRKFSQSFFLIENSHGCQRAGWKDEGGKQRTHIYSPLLEVLFLPNVCGIVHVDDTHPSMHDRRPCTFKGAVSRHIPQLHWDVGLHACMAKYTWHNHHTFAAF